MASLCRDELVPRPLVSVYAGRPACARAWLISDRTCAAASPCGAGAGAGDDGGEDGGDDGAGDFGVGDFGVGVGEGCAGADGDDAGADGDGVGDGEAG
jgi:hypothetical protein